MAGRARLRRHHRLCARHVDPHPGGDRPAAAPQPRGAELDGLPAAQARLRLHGHDAGDHRHPAVERARRPAPRFPGQGAGRPAAGAGGRRAQLRPVHQRPADRHRRDVPGARRVAVRAAQGLPRLPRRPGTDPAELPGQAGHRDARHAGRRTGRTGGHGGGGPAPDGPGRLPPGPAQPGGRRVRAADRGRHRRLGRGLPAHPGPRQPRAPLAADRAAGRALGGGRLRTARAPRRLPRVRAPRRTLAGPAGAAARPRPGRPGHRPGRPGRGGPRPALAGARGPAGVVRPHRPARHHRHRGPHRRPPGRLRGRVRRLGGAARAGAREGRARAPRRRPAGGPRGGRRRPDRTDRRPGAGPVPRGRSGPGRALPDRRRRPPRHGRGGRHLLRHPEHQLHQRLLHRLPLLRLRPAPHRRGRLHPLAGAGRRPGRAGLGGGRHRGLHAGRHPPGPARHRLLRHRPRGEGAGARHPRARLLAHGGRQRRDPHRAVDPGLAAAGQGVGPGQHPRHRRRDPGRRGPLGAHQGQAAGRHLGRGGHHRARTGPALLVHDDVRARGHPEALARPPAAARRDPATDGRLHRVRDPAVHPHQRARLPGRHRPARPERPGQPRGGRDGPAAAAPAHPQHPDQLGQAGRRGRGRDAPLGRQRPRRHADGGDHLADGRLGVRQLQVGARPPGDRRGRGPPAPPAHHHLRRGAGRAAGAALASDGHLPELLPVLD